MSESLIYARDLPVKMAESASLVAGNLAVLQGLEEGGVAYGIFSGNLATFTYVSSSVVSSVESKSTCFSVREQNASSRTITGMEWCRLKSSRVVLVLTSYCGFRISSWNCSEVAYENIFESRKESYDQRFAKGVASVDDTVCVGTSEGNITVLYVPPTGPDVVFSRHLQGHSTPITALCRCSMNQVASSDESGMIIVWSNPVISAESRLVINNQGSYPCLSLCYWRDLLVAGFSNGVIRVHSAETGKKMIEIAAHGRSVTALDVATDSGLLLSVSEDCTATVWTMTEGAKPKVSHLCSLHVEDQLLCGGRFCDSRGDTLALTAYDSPFILTYTRKLNQSPHHQSPSTHPPLYT